ncbi:hypothetical protein N9241_00280 [bacterium]|nr:hypothetical protein [bacterium]
MAYFSFRRLHEVGIRQGQEHLEDLTDLLILEAKNAGSSSAVTDALSNAAHGISTGTNYALSQGSEALAKSIQLLQEVSESDVANTIKTEVSEMATKTGEAAASGWKESKRVASEASESAASKVKSLRNRLKSEDGKSSK